MVITDEMTWRASNEYKSVKKGLVQSNFRKLFFKCNKVKTRDKQCVAKCSIVWHASSEKFSIYRNELPVKLRILLL